MDITLFTINTHKGFTSFNTRFILPQLRDAIRSTGADIVFLQEVVGEHELKKKAFLNGLKPRSTNTWPTRSGLMWRMV